MTVHVIEDDVSVADSLRLLLTEVGHGVKIHRDGQSFMDCAIAPGDVAVLDLDLPDKNGSSILKHFTGSGADIRFIVLTGLPQAAIDREILAFADVPVLRKPVATRELLGLIGPAPHPAT